MPLERWLRELQSPSPPAYLLGGTGHLILSAEEKKLVQHRLTSEILPQVVSALGDRTLLILTGLAPGADHLFNRAAVDYARHHQIHHRLIGLLPLPTAVMVDDWAEKMQAEGHTVSSQQRTQQLADMEAERVACDRIVHLMPPGTSESLIHERSFRQLQYQRLAACLAEQSDALVAILRSDSNLQPGGTAQVVQWRQHLNTVPAEISTLPLRKSPFPQSSSLFTIDPEIAEQHS